MRTKYTFLDAKINPSGETLRAFYRADGRSFPQIPSVFGNAYKHRFRDNGEKLMARLSLLQATRDALASSQIASLRPSVAFSFSLGAARRGRIKKERKKKKGKADRKIPRWKKIATPRCSSAIFREIREVEQIFSATFRGSLRMRSLRSFCSQNCLCL